MKILHFFLLIFFSSSLVIAQDTPFSVEVAAGPTLVDKFAYYDGSFHDKYLNEEGPAWSFEGVIRGLYSFSDRWSAGIGLSYSRKGYSLEVPDFASQFGGIRFGDTTEGVNQNSKTFYFHYYIETPVFLRYNFVNDSKFTFYGQGGFAPSVYLTSRSRFSETSREGKYDLERHNYVRPLNLGLHAAVGALFSVKEDWNLGVELGLNSHFFRLENGFYFRDWLYSHNLNLVLSRSF